MRAAEYAVQDACNLLNVSPQWHVPTILFKSSLFHKVDAQLTAYDLQVKMAAARDSDQRDLADRLDILSQNDQNILRALQEGDSHVRRLEELVTAFMKVRMWCSMY